MSQRWALLLVILTCVVCASSAHAGLNVPGDYPTVQDAVNAANPGDAIVVAPGYYYSSFTVPSTKSGISITGAGTGSTYSYYGAYVYAQDVTIADLSFAYGSYGLYVSAGASCSMTNVTCWYQNYGVYVYQGSATLDDVRCYSMKQWFGIGAYGTGASLTIAGGRVWSCPSLGVLLWGGATGSVTGMSCEYNNSGLSVQSGANATFTDCVAMYNNYEGLNVLNDASATANNCTLSENDQGCRCYGATSALTIEGGVIADNTSYGAYYHGGAGGAIKEAYIGGNKDSGIRLEGSAPELIGNTITGNSASYGGGLYLDSSSPKLADNDIKDNTATAWGGGLYLYYSSPEMEHNDITGNTATYGGGMFPDHSSPQMEDNDITGNSASYGGGLYVYHSSPEMANNSIAGNTAISAGGMMLNNSSAELKDNHITDNTATDKGGGMYLSYSSAQMEDNDIAGNTATYGGGMYLSASSPELNDNRITDNTATYKGGGLYVYSSSPTLTDNDISGNSTLESDSLYEGGGGLYLQSSAPTLTGNRITGNAAQHRGGGLYLYYASPTLTDNDICGNSTAGSAAWDEGGAGLYLYGSSPTLIGNDIAENSSGRHGGGLFLRNCPSPGPIVNGNDIADNSTWLCGGGLFVLYSSPILTNNTICGNSASWAGGLVEYSGSASILTGNTIADNHGGGVWQSGGNATITNCILWGNASATHPDLEDASATYSDVETGNVSGTGNISEDPMFLGVGDYHVQVLSPCVDCGSNEAPSLPDTDKDGNPRILGFAVDMGAYEQADTTPPTVSLDSPSPSVLWPPDHRSVPVAISGAVEDHQSGLARAWLEVDDEYDEFDSEHEVTDLLDENGNLEMQIDLIAWRDGEDLDGRHYEIALHAVDNAGNEAEPVSVDVWVPHDAR
jgi:parallel beta-helix repeat protein